MEILVCIKQVPGTTSVEVDPVTGVLKRDGIEAKMNPYDLYALELGLELGARTDGHVSVITMGPDQAREVLLEAVCMGAERGYLISDRCFAGADVCLILCGKQTTDGDTAQVGAETAEFLGIAHGANILEVLETGDTFVTVRMNLENKIQTQKMELPCLLTVDKDVNTPRLPSYKKRIGMDPGCIKVMGLDDLEDRDSGHYGLKGSPTQVERIFPPDKKTDKEIMEGTGRELAQAMAAVLRKHKFI